MSEPSSPSKNSLTSWWKQLKKNEGDLAPPTPLSINNPIATASGPAPVLTQSSSSPLSPSPQMRSASPSLLPPVSSPTRPFLGYKSRSSHTVRPLSSYMENNASQEKLKQHRDSFIQQRQLDYIGDSNVFGFPLEDSIKVAEAKIYISSDRDGLIRYGSIPRVVALCGSYLKKNGLDVEGIFRVAGSTKRIKQLQIIFSTPPNYGSKIDWDGYTVHDAASLFRRFLQSLPEPLIPLSMYEMFREPLRSRPNIVRYLKEKERKLVAQTEQTGGETAATDEGRDEEKSSGLLTEEEKKLKKKAKKDKIKKERKEALKEYAKLIDQLPELQRQLLFYILDLLAIFNSHCDKNLMPAKNLAAIFQPSILSHSDHDMSPEEYALSSLVIEFMIEYSYKILPAAQEASSASTSADRKPSNLMTESSLPNGNSSKSTSSEQPKQTLTPPDVKYPPSSAGTSNSLVLPPNSYFTRKHSKSMSSVQSPSDMLRVNGSKASLKLVHTNNTDEIDSALDTEDDDVSRSPQKAHLKQGLGTFKASSKITLPSPSKMTPLDQPPSIRVDYFSNSSGDKTPGSPGSINSGSPSSSNNNGSFLHSVVKPLNFMSPQKATSSSIDDNLSLSDPASTSAANSDGHSRESDRESRWDNEGNSLNGERKKWFRKLRSRSTSKSRK